MLKILDYQPKDLMNKSLYEYHHAGDSESLMGSFKSGKFHVHILLYTIKYLKTQNL